MLKDEIIAELNLMVKAIMRGDIEVDTDPADSVVEIEHETPNFVLSVKIDRGTCVTCEMLPPAYGTTECDNCRSDKPNNIVDITEFLNRRG